MSKEYPDILRQYIVPSIPEATLEYAHRPDKAWTIQWEVYRNPEWLRQFINEFMQPVATNDNTIYYTNSNHGRAAFLWLCGEEYCDIEAPYGFGLVRMERYGWTHLQGRVYRKHFPISWRALEMSLV